MAFASNRASRKSSLRLIPLMMAFAALTLAQYSQSLGENFRIETKIFVGKEKVPVSETTTLFHEGVVYDFLKSPAQTAVFNKPGGKNPGRFILLNDQQQIRTIITTDRLSGAIEDLRQWASEQKQPFLKFAANPEFDESFEPGNGKLVLASHVESYSVETTPAKNSKAAREYREFLDWYAQLNTLLTGGPPPQPRLELNAALTRHKVIPSTVELTRAGQDEPLRAEHKFTWLLSQDDMERIEGVRAAQVGYRSVQNKEYLELTTPLDESK